MSVFDLFRGFFGVPGGHYRGQRDPFFETMTHDEDDDDEEEDGYYYDGLRGEQQDPFDSAWRFGFSFGPDGMRIQEPPGFGQLLKEMEEMFSHMGRFDGHADSGHASSFRPRDSEGRGSSGNPFRDFMLKGPDEPRPQRPLRPRDGPGPTYESPFHGGWEYGLYNCFVISSDLDSAVSAEGLDLIRPPPGGQNPQQPKTRSFFQSVSVSKVVKPDGTVEERRTVRDGQGNEETTVTRSGPDHEGGQRPDFPQPFSDLRDDSLFSKFFGGFK
uniref:HCLS1 associated protein X-1 n=1 Tax=Neogobius melanostomus TaxID=47308 RepID=A0A8C6SCY3_9GOBI